MEDYSRLHAMEYVRPTTMICADNYRDSRVFQIAIGHAVLGIILISTVWVSLKLFRKLDYFLVKERAPTLALLQLITFLGTLLVPYSVEIAVIFGTRWPADNSGEIPLIRKIAKSSYMIFKTTCYILFLPRILVIYSNWKVPRRNKPYFWKVVGNEKTSLLVVSNNLDYHRDDDCDHIWLGFSFWILHYTLSFSRLVFANWFSLNRSKDSKSDLFSHIRITDVVDMLCIP